jgi:hypothetical protein
MKTYISFCAHLEPNSLIYMGTKNVSKVVDKNKKKHFLSNISLTVFEINKRELTPQIFLFTFPDLFK